MKNTVIIKGNRYGISIVMDRDMDFPDLLEELKDKLKQSEKFFDSDKQLAVTFEGRELTNEELDQALTVIRESSKLNIQYVMEENSDLEQTFYQLMKKEENTTSPQEEPVFEEPPVNVSELENLSELKEPEPIFAETLTDAADMQDNNTGLFYKGTLRSGQTLETKDSLVIIGDVNPGATVIAGGNIVIIGALKGSVIAGSNGNPNSFVLALSMEPIQIQIADIIARSSDTKRAGKIKQETMIALIVDNQICIEPITKTAIQNIHF